MDMDTWNSNYENQGMSTEKVLEDALTSGNLKLTYLATFGLKDSLRDTVKSAVWHAREEGNINVRMVSGDHLETAKVVAEKAGILTEEESVKPFSVMSAQDFRSTVGDIHTVIGENGEEITTV